MTDGVTVNLVTLPATKRAPVMSFDEPAAYVELPDHLRSPEPNDFPFLTEYVRFSRKWSPRSPAAAHEAVALHVLSAAAAGRVEYEYGSRQRAALYQFVVADSTLYAKTTAANIGRDLLAAAGLDRVIIGRATPQSFFDQCLQKLPADYDTLPADKQQKILERVGTAGQRAWIADEFGSWAAAMLREGSVYYDFRSLLLEIYDGPHTVERSTRTYGTAAIQDPTLSLFALSTFAHVESIAGAHSPFWRDGLLARFAFVTTAEGEQHSNAMFPNERRELPPSLVETLQDFDRYLGYPSVSVQPVYDSTSKDGKRVLRNDVTVARSNVFYANLSQETYEAAGNYDSWLRNTAASGEIPEDLVANYGRMADRVLKIAALLCALEKRTTVQLRDWQKGLAIVERQRQSLHWTYERLTSKSGSVDAARRSDDVLRFVTTERVATARQILQKFRRRFASRRDLQLELDSLVLAGELFRVDGARNSVLYATNSQDLDSVRKVAK